MIQINNIYKSYGNKTVIDGVTLNIKKGEIYGIIGQSGAGKSTLLRCLNGLETYDEGSITVMGKELNNLNSDDLRHLRKDQGMIFQNFNLLKRLNVYENVALPMKAWGFASIQIKDKVNELLKLVGIEDKIYSMPDSLSGGQKQRVAIARALTLNPKILLCDEATSALDPKTTKSILSLLKDINNKLDITIIVVTHQMEVIKEICTNVAFMKDGKIKYCGSVEELFLNPKESFKEFLGHEDVLPKSGVNIRLFFEKDASERCIITSMARELDINFSIVWGKLENFRENVLGSLVINIDQNHEEEIIEYLTSNNIPWEVA